MPRASAGSGPKTTATKRPASSSSVTGSSGKSEPPALTLHDKAAALEGSRSLSGGSLEDVIRVRGARQHNLKNVDLTIPRNRLVVFTGVSGSGKSSLAFDTIFAEGQRRYVESLSA